VTVSDDKGDVGTGDIRFQNGTPDPAASSFTLTFAPAGTTGTLVTFDFSTIPRLSPRARNRRSR